MKTPREILTAQHRAAEPKLDAIRAGVLAAEFKAGPASSMSRLEDGGKLETGATSFFLLIWRELILPSRRIWAGLAAAWLLLFIVNVSQRDTVSSVTGRPVRSQAVMMSWQAQQRWMNELLADRSLSPEADRPKNSPLKPRTEIVEVMTG